MTLKASENSEPIPSPCVRNCCLDEHDICLGCKRSYEEILAWHNATDLGKREILQRCKLRREQTNY